MKRERHIGETSHLGNPDIEYAFDYNPKILETFEISILKFGVNSRLEVESQLIRIVIMERKVLNGLR